MDALLHVTASSLTRHPRLRLNLRPTWEPPTRSFCVQMAATTPRKMAAQPTPPERRSANYMPNLWRHDYIESSTKQSIDIQDGRRVAEFKERIRVKLVNEEVEPVVMLELVDALRRLCVDYHFRDEIKNVMASIWRNDASLVLEKASLYLTSLLFRLLRQNHHEVSQDVFDTFTDENGVFRSHFRDDPEALLSLYEASFLSFEGEEILDNARRFTTDHLKHHLQNNTTLGDVDPVLRERIAQALDLPLHRRVPRLQTRLFINMEERKNTTDPLLLEFSKLDFNMVQTIHRGELAEASRWWRELGLAEKLTFCRDRVVENYYCVLGGHSEPEFWYYRQRMTRIFCLIAAMDDIYDIYGTLDELEIFTDAVVRWDVNALDGLPDCMKLCFLALFNTVNEIAYNHLRETGLDITPYLKKTWTELCNAWLVEARWYHKKQEATFEKYIDNAWVSMGWPVVCVHGYFLVTRDVTKEALECLGCDPDLIRYSSMLIRFWNDLSTSKAETARGDVSKSIQCYMREENASEAVAREHIERMITMTWKKFNKSCRESVVLGENFLDLVMDGTRILHSIYHRGDGYARPDKETKDSIMSLMFEPISVIDNLP